MFLTKFCCTFTETKSKCIMSFVSKVLVAHFAQVVVYSFILYDEIGN